MSGAPVDLSTYVALLAEQLRQAGVEKERVREIAADVRSHVRETREDPVHAFGQPAEYARQWSDPPSGRRVLAQVAIRAAGALGALGVLNGVRASEYHWGDVVPITTGDIAVASVWIAILAAAPWTLDLWLSRRAARAVGEMSRVPDWMVRSGAIAIIAIIVIMTSSVGGFTDTEAEVGPAVPRWLLVAGGVLLAPLYFTAREPTDRTAPRDPLDRPRPVRVVVRDAVRALRPYKGG